MLFGFAKGDAVEGEDLVAMVTDDVRDNQLEDSISKDNNGWWENFVTHISQLVYYEIWIIGNRKSSVAVPKIQNSSLFC